MATHLISGWLLVSLSVLKSLVFVQKLTQGIGLWMNKSEDLGLAVERYFENPIYLQSRCRLSNFEWI